LKGGEIMKLKFKLLSFALIAIAVSCPGLIASHWGFNQPKAPRK